MDIVETHNGFGWTSRTPNQITEEFVSFILALKNPNEIDVLDVGAGLGVAIQPALKTGARVIALDPSRSHLNVILDEAQKAGVASHLKTIQGRIPNGPEFTNLAAIHSSNVLHFLTGFEIEQCAAEMFRWLRPGGGLFIQVGTIYAGHIKQLLPIFQEKLAQGDRWPGETECAKSYVLPELRALTPNFMNYLDEPRLDAVFTGAGFQILKSWYYTRHDIPAMCRNDGREHFGLVCLKPDSVNL